MGYTKHAIIFEANHTQWAIVDDPEKEPNYKILGLYQPQASSNFLPKGTGDWLLFDEFCKGKRKLKLSSVSCIAYKSIMWGENQ